MKLTLRSVTFSFHSPSGEIMASLNLSDLVQWTVTMPDHSTITIDEFRTHQFVNQTRARAIIMDALNKKNPDTQDPS